MIGLLKTIHSKCTGPFCDTILMSALALVIGYVMVLSIAQLTT